MGPTKDAGHIQAVSGAAILKLRRDVGSDQEVTGCPAEGVRN